MKFRRLPLLNFSYSPCIAFFQIGGLNIMCSLSVFISQKELIPRLVRSQSLNGLMRCGSSTIRQTLFALIIRYFFQHVLKFSCLPWIANLVQIFIFDRIKPRHASLGISIILHVQLVSSVFNLTLKHTIGLRIC